MRVELGPWMSGQGASSSRCHADLRRIVCDEHSDQRATSPLFLSATAIAGCSSLDQPSESARVNRPDTAQANASERASRATTLFTNSGRRHGTQHQPALFQLLYRRDGRRRARPRTRTIVSSDIAAVGRQTRWVEQWARDVPVADSRRQTLATRTCARRSTRCSMSSNRSSRSGR